MFKEQECLSTATNTPIIPLVCYTSSLHYSREHYAYNYLFNCAILNSFTRINYLLHCYIIANKVVIQHKQLY